MQGLEQVRLSVVGLLPKSWKTGDHFAFRVVHGSSRQVMSGRWPYYRLCHGLLALTVAVDSSHMCGRFGLSDIEQMEEPFGVEFTEGLAFEPTYNAAPGQDLPVIVPEASGRSACLDAVGPGTLVGS